MLPIVFANQWMVIIIVLLVLLACSELGYRTGMRLHLADDEPRKGQIGGVQGAVLGMLGLLLGFTFAMAVNRYDNRRDTVLQEANSIGTTYLRAAFLPKSHRTAMEDLLRRYVDQRIEFFDAQMDPARLDAVETETAQLHQEMWAHAVAAADEVPTPVTATFVNALNDTIDLDATRLHAMRSKIPGAVWLLVLVVAGTSCYASGYGTGAAGARSMLANVLLPVLISVVITLIADLDRPTQGLISIGQQPLTDLKAGMAKPAN